MPRSSPSLSPRQDDADPHRQASGTAAVDIHLLVEAHDGRRGRDQAAGHLARLLGMETGTLVWSETLHGRPGLADYPDLDFNLSHSGGIFALAAGKIRVPGAGRPAPDGLGAPDAYLSQASLPAPAASPAGPAAPADHSAPLGTPQLPGLGIDLELLRSDRDFEALARATLSDREYDWFCRAASTGEPMIAFYRLWTWKEAWLKARGLRAWDLAQAPDHPAVSGDGARASDGSTCMAWLAGTREEPRQALVCLCLPPDLASAGPVIQVAEPFVLSPFIP